MVQTMGLADWIGVGVRYTQGYIFFRLIGCFLEVRPSAFAKVVSWILGTYVCGMVIFPNDAFNVTGVIPLFFVMLVVGYRAKILVRVSMVLLFFPIIVGLNFLALEISGYFIVNYASVDSVMNPIIVDVFLILVLFFWLFFLRMMKKREGRTIELLDDKSWLLMDIICLASLFAVVSGVYFTPEESYKMWLCMLACVVTNLGSIRLVFYLAESIRSEMEKRNLKLQRDYYEQLEANQLEIRRFRHDINNHFSVAAQLLEEGRVTEAKEYFQELSGQLSVKGRSFCKNSVVNAVLNAKYNRALEYGIDCFFHIEIEKLMFIAPIDVCTIFSNTLDNAIEGCMQLNKEKRKISVKARCMENGYFSYEIRNSKGNEIRKEKGKYKSSKKKERNHGLGIENVKEVVRRYQGNMEISYTEEEFCVVILVSGEHSLLINSFSKTSNRKNVKPQRI